MTTPERVTHREVREILRTFQDSGWAAMTLELDGMRITVGKDGPPATAGQSAAPAPVPALASTPMPAAAPATAVPPAASAPAAPAPPAPAADVDTAGCIEVRSQTVGAFWVAPGPGEPPFVQVGQIVEAGQQIAIVEVMKLMNPVVTPHGGEIVQICATNADLVEFDQVLFLIRPTDG
ncbi:acetyl-CoA carboxylase biotin carboxyl carrier protein subunit [Rhodococcus pseudokoreensis]|uniref:Biotin carboxyl carrier protein of acetyl-CoA carboxylase n=1 Tax=Rhodococcus pseudokoreensis TaxID=2811421 RepID=A0A974ZW17_9NOCA|nr:biotin/lipoyl-containing protein [Rhodococcus pseudokoreensis]QSE92141.1 acetyl-CoA carboxylase biotin carboxyl carrier protein subunit [Rhodococcus pseudokoreensis]